MTLKHVEEAIVPWADSAATLWAEIVKTLESYHPIMAELMRAEDDSEIQAWASGTEGEVEAAALVSLGMLVRVKEGGLQRSCQLESLQRLQKLAEVPVEELKAKQEHRRRVEGMAAHPESATLEFKSTARWNLHTLKSDPALELAIAKTVAGFLNCSGGTLLIGVSDDGSIVGIEEDLRAYGGSFDRFERWLRGDLLAKSLGADVSTSSVDVRFHELGGKCVVEMEARRHPQPVWMTHGQVTELCSCGTATKRVNLKADKWWSSSRTSGPTGPSLGLAWA